LNAEEEQLGFKYMKEGKYEEAIKWFKEAIKVNPQESSSYYIGLGASCMQLKRDKEAIEYCKNAINIDSQNSAIYTILGEVYNYQHDYQKAIEYFKKAIKLNYQDSNNYNGMGRVCAEKGNYAEALKWFKEATQINPHDSANYTGGGRIYALEGNDVEAIKWFKEGININPHDSANYAGIGDIYTRSSDTEALKWFKEGIKINPHDSANYTGIGKVCRHLGNYTEARKWYKEAIKLNPHNSASYTGIGQVYIDEDNYKEAIKWFKEGININPHDSANYAGIGEAYRREGNYTEALKWLNKAKGLCDGFSYADEQLGRLYMAMGEYKKAEAVLTSIVDNKGIQALGYWGCPFQALGELYSHMSINSQKRKVLDNYMKAADMEYRTYNTQFETAKICYEYGDYENAMRYVERALHSLDNAKELNKYQLLKGFILINMKQYNEAEGIFNAVLKSSIAVEVLVAKVGLGHIEITRNNYTVAKEYFQEMLKVDRADPMANLGMAWINSNQNKHEEALSYYDAISADHPSQVLRLNAPYILVLLGKGNALMGLKRIDEAKELFDKVLMIEPENEYALAELGIVSYNKQDDKRAEELFKESLRVSKTGYTCPYEGLGLLYLRSGKTKEAEENFKKAIEVNPNIEYKKYNGLAKIYLKEGRYKEAKELLDKSIKNYPYDNEAKELLKQLETK
jgi:tetratricopeptide (TPR) repeat protein